MSSAKPPPPPSNHVHSTVYLEDQFIIFTLDKKSDHPTCAVAFHAPSKIISSCQPDERSNPSSPPPLDDLSSGSADSYPTTPTLAVNKIRLGEKLEVPPQSCLLDRLSVACRTGSYQASSRTVAAAAASYYSSSLRTASTPPCHPVETLQAYGTDGRSFRFIPRDAGHQATLHQTKTSAFVGAMCGSFDQDVSNRAGAIVDSASLPMAVRWKYEVAKEEDRYMSAAAHTDRVSRIEEWSRSIETMLGRREELEEPIHA